MTTRNEQDKPTTEAQAATGGMGLSHSTPLVTIPAAPVLGGIRPVVAHQHSLTSSSTASSAVSLMDHPLAFFPITGTGISSVAPGTGGPSQTTTPEFHHHPLATPQPGIILAPPPPPSSATTIPAPLIATTAGPPSPQHPRSAPSSQHPATSTTATAIPHAQTLDDLTDAFLSVVELDGSSLLQQQQRTPLLQPAAIPNGLNDLQLLHLLVARRSWGDVLLLSERLLRGTSSHYAPIYASLLNNRSAGLPTLDSQQAILVWILMVLCQAYVKMKRYTELGLEIERWSFLHHIDNKAPSWIPWSLHITAAFSLVFTCPVGNTAVDALWAIRSDIASLLEENNKNDDDSHNKTVIALLQVEHALSNAFIRRLDWRMALVSQQRMLEVLPAVCRAKCQLDGTLSNTIKQDGDAAAVLLAAYQCEVLSRQGRILLQVGALPEASEIFDNASLVWSEVQQQPEHTKGSVNKDSIVLQIPAQLAVNHGLSRFSQERFDEARDYFQQAVQHLRKSGSLLSSSTASIAFDPYDLLPTGSHLLGVSPAHALYSDTVNNMALCGLYTCQLPEALRLLESLVRQDPAHFLTERVALNLCTLYELSNETAQSARKKRVLQLIAKRFALHDIAQENFRL